MERCADAEPSNNHVLDTLEADGANVKEPATVISPFRPLPGQRARYAATTARRFRADAASCSNTEAVTSHSMQASVTLWP
ncbi:hypothetical protein AAU01_04140 [Paenarthrobacter aurescens]|uniref:Uncharacterized protein n=1 Tax=Paenarthrobacter aurescens TaxID=43663 RepID=A0A4Y3NG18_PAEAU|nr:hypothetical protein AAU01_04140 [Paenarthrobacter aurescens]